MRRIALTSKSFAKKAAVERFALAFLGDASIETFEVDSQITAVPRNDQQALRGCQNRLNGFLNDPRSKGFDYAVALEGLISEIGAIGYFVYGWSLFYDFQTKRTAIGCSGKVQMPIKMARYTDSERALKENFLALYPSSAPETLSEIGMNGIITNGIYTRADEFFDSLRCAYGFLCNPLNFETIEK